MCATSRSSTEAITTIEVELLTDHGNNAVLRLPGRKFPGILVQVDSSNALVETVQEAMSAIEAGQAKDAVEIVRGLAVELEEAQARYEAAPSAHGLAKP